MREKLYIFWLLIGVTIFVSSYRDKQPMPSNEAYCKTYLRNKTTNDRDYVLSHHFSGSLSEHRTYNQTYKGIPIEGAYVYFHFYPNKNPLVIDENIAETIRIDIETDGVGDKLIRKIGGVYTVLYQTVHTDSISGSVMVTYHNKDTSYTLDGLLHKQVKDTSVAVGVFYPNPVVSSGTSYGQNGLVDDNDKNSSGLADQQSVQMLRLLLDTVTGSLNYDTSLVRFKNISKPNDLSFDAEVLRSPIDRSMPDFETANVYFHLLNFIDQLDSLGYKNLARPIEVDPHALNGVDNSAFNSFAIVPTLQFGIGGVDDAEDAQVIIHEYVHSLVHAASPYTWAPTERRSIEEGVCDYLCMSYSNSLSGSFDNRVFSWDGHNPFFVGYDVLSKKQYTTDLAGNTDSDREIWSSVLMSLELELGAELARTLTLEHLFYLSQYSTMPSMAAQLLEIDKILNDSKHAHKMIRIFAEHSISPTGKFDRLYTELDNELKGHLIQHRLDPNSPFTVVLNKNSDYDLYIYSLGGQHLYTTSFTGYQHRITEAIMTPNFLFLVVIRDRHNKDIRPLTFKAYNYF